MIDSKVDFPSPDIPESRVILPYPAVKSTPSSTQVSFVYAKRTFFISTAFI